MTIKLYLWDNALELNARITAIGKDPQPWVRLSETLFHPQGGGQKADRGHVDGIAVTLVAHADDGEVNHYLNSADAFHVGDVVAIRVDGIFRAIQARAHSAGHLIAALTEHRFSSLRAVSGHHWPGESRVEFDGSISCSIEELQEFLNQDLRAAIHNDLTVFVKLEDGAGSRTVQFSGYPPVPCGGTHVTHIGQIGEINLTKIKSKSGKIRVSYATR